MRNLFFFSSRRRHTRYWRDWSSDVCSSDLLCARHRDAGTRWDDYRRVTLGRARGGCATRGDRGRHGGGDPHGRGVRGHHRARRGQDRQGDPRRYRTAQEKTANRTTQRQGGEMTETKTLKNFVGGEYVDASNGRTYELVNPATGQTFAEAPVSEQADVDRAFEAADK